MNNPKEYYSLITNIDIGDVARELIGERITDESGGVFYVDCPRHTSIHHRSLNIDIKKQSWYCFGCTVGGDVLQLVEFIQSGVVTKNASGRMPDTHRAARDYLARKANIPPLSQWNLSPEQIVETEARRSEEELVFGILKDIAEFYHKKLLDRPDVQEAFRKQYGISDDTRNSLQIGFADNDGVLKFLKEKYQPCEIAKTGCFNFDYQEHLLPVFKNRYVFPYWKQGRVVYLIARQSPWTEEGEYERAKYKKLQLPNDQHKYVSTCVNNRYFYNEDALIAKSEFVVITEGVTDCISLMEHGFTAFSPVTNKFSDSDLEKLFNLTRRYDRIYICQDNEPSEAGFKGAMKTAHYLESRGLKVLVSSLPMGDKQTQARTKLDELPPDTPKEVADQLRLDTKIDVNEYFLDHSADEFLAVLATAKTPIHYAIASIPPDMPDDERNNMLYPVMRRLAALKPIDLDRYVDVIQAHFGKKLSKKTIQDTIAAVRREEKSKERKKFHSDAPEGSCRRLIDQMLFDTTEEEGKPNWNTISEGVYRWFKNNGAIFFHDTEQNRYVYFEGRVFSMKPDKNTNPAYLSMLYKHTQIPITTSPTGRVFHECFDSIAYNDGDMKEPHYWLYTDRARHTVFFNLNNAENEIVKITPDGISIIHNGINDDNLVFHHSPTMRPVEYLPDVNIDAAEQLFKSLIFDNLACPPEERVLITTWISCFLLLDFAGTRPLLRFEGATHSGKSTASKLISALIFGDENLENPTIAANYTEGAKQPLLVIDNIELKNATDEFVQFLLTAVTGIVRTKRRQGTDTDTVRESVRCLINTSGIEPLAGLSELTTRTLLVDFDIACSTVRYFLDSETLQGIMDARNIMLSAIFKKTQMILRLLRDGGHPVIMKLFADELGQHPKRRCNDFLSLMYLMLLVGMGEDDMKKYMGVVHPVFKTILGGQQRLSEAQEIEANPFVLFVTLIVKERLLAIAADDNGPATGYLERFKQSYGLSFSGDYTIVDAQARDLFSAFNTYARAKGMKAPYMSAAQLSKRLRNDLGTIEKAGIEVKQGKNRKSFLTVTLSVSPSLISAIDSRVQTNVDFEE